MAQFLADTLVDQHVGVHRHTHGEHDTGDAGQGKGRLQRSERAQQHEHVGDQGDVGDPARAIVVNDHEDHHHEHGHRKGDEALTNVLGTERRTYHGLVDDAGRCREGAGLQDVRQISGFLKHLGLVSGAEGDAAATIGNGLNDGGRALHHAIEGDGDVLSDVVLGHLLPDERTFLVHLHAHYGVALHGVEVLGGI